MAKEYYATNQIRHGMPSGEVKVFELGERVMGLTKDEMVALWNAGALTERDPDVAAADRAAMQARIDQLEAELAEARTKMTEAEEAAVAAEESPAVEEEAAAEGEAAAEEAPAEEEAPPA
jgi:hypothetical protein